MIETLGTYCPNESAKLRAWRAYLLACLRAWRVYVLTCFHAWRAYVLGVLTCLASLVCLRVYVRACYDEMFYFLTCLCTWCAFLSYLLYISTLKFKNFHGKKLCALLS